MQTITPAKDYEPMRVIWTRTDCETLERAGVLNYRYELIEGVILRKKPQNIRHARLVRRALLWLVSAFGEDYVLDQATIRVHRADDTTNAPEPDVILLNKPDTEIPTTQPRPEDVRLLIEIADSTKNYDLGTKATLYARAGVPEYWVVSVEERIIYVHSAPQPDGTYTRREAKETETLSPAGYPDAVIAAADLLPPVNESAPPASE
ncbi:MAG: Uma2 family endonuclease [Fibrella sp.]|nr:Uma2 family endonuclease [Armatimonadota bacterium]